MQPLPPPESPSGHGAPGGPPAPGAVEPGQRRGAGEERGRAEARPVVDLHRLLSTLDEQLLSVVTAPRGLDVAVRDVVILDPDDDPEPRPGDLALVVGARGRAAARLVRIAGRAGAAAVAVKPPGGGRPPGGAGRGGWEEGERAALRRAAEEAGVALLAVPPAARWERLEELARSVLLDALLADSDLEPARDGLTGDLVGPGTAGHPEPDDLFALAQTVAGLTGGLVSIEDTSSHVLAYSRSAGETDAVDELRRLSILGRQGPERYLAMLRAWGVYRRLREGEEVVRVEAHRELGIRARLAVGVHAGGRQLGTIWVQEGTRPLSPTSDRVLLGAARVVALHLVRRRSGLALSARWNEDLLAGVLEGRLPAAEVLARIGVAPGGPGCVVAFTLPGAPQPARDPDRAAEPMLGRTEIEWERAETLRVIALHAAAYRRRALVTVLGVRLYVLLPDLPRHGGQAAAVGWTREVVAEARRHGPVVRAAVGAVIVEPDGIRASRAEADRVLDALAADGGAGGPAPGGGAGPEVAVLDDVRTRVLMRELLGLLAERPGLRDPGTAALLRRDAERSGVLVESLAAYLDHHGDVRPAAEALHVHPNTLRYRVRRAAETAGLDLDDPDQRLLVHLQLRLARSGLADGPA
ncbi:PucR family transcriptional regulator [Allostreptomyces psammosilenae]|uniref:Transcriptional regulator n=1 Tax=Allostreptomyces psammosilenae TaxID=1892865 RepID=A0A852ZTJ1_9ACTN|nr:helix-turn-helix domain-containing protein [Allostreptomyces psammosilenae]NYI04094.1 hypothetical protein [Allostreptomyces psammosilenae]